MTARLHRVRAGGEDSGFAMVLVLGVSFVITLLALAALANATSGISQTKRDQDYYSSLAAADAGIDDFLSRLNANDTVWQTLPLDSTYNPRAVSLPQPACPTAGAATCTASPAPTPVPAAGTTTSQGGYSYRVDVSNAYTSGDLTITSTGVSGKRSRTVVDTLRRRSSLDYVYFSDYETFYPDLPGAYYDLTSVHNLCQQRHYFDQGVVGNNAGVTGAHRNDRYCAFRETGNGGAGLNETIVGDAHSNDIFFVFDGAHIAGQMTSTCSSVQVPNNTSCPGGLNTIRHNSYSTDTRPPQSWAQSLNNIPAFVANDTSPSPSTATFDKPPLWAPYLAPPTTNTALLGTAKAGGCVFTGPTRILYKPNGTADVTSPSTKQILGPCGGSGNGNTALSDVWTGLTNKTITISTLPSTTPGSVFNGVIYVQNVPAAGSGDVNAAATPGTCTNPTGKPYLRTSGATTDVWPSQLDNSPTTPTPWFDCRAGSAFVGGTLHGSVTVSTADSVFITSTLLYSQSDASGAPPTTCPQLPAVCDVQGLIATNYVTTYHPCTGTCNGANTTPTDYATIVNPTVNAAILALNACWTTMNPYGGVQGGTFHLKGSIGHKYRCPMGTGGYGYAKDYEYDTRLHINAPPHMLDLFNTAWKITSFGEQDK